MYAKIGVLGQNALAEALSVSTQPFQTLQDFQNENGLKNPDM